MRIERIEEFFISSSTNALILALLQASFPDFPSSQTYFKQVPNFRFLGWDKEELIAHASIEFRIIKVGSILFRVFLIGDICVKNTHQHQNIASKIISEAEKIAKKGAIDFFLVAVNNPSLYLKSGFTKVDNDCRWVIIQRHSTIGIRQRNINNSLMIKPINDAVWNKGVIDFLGPII